MYRTVDARFIYIYIYIYEIVALVLNSIYIKSNDVSFYNNLRWWKTRAMAKHNISIAPSMIKETSLNERNAASIKWWTILRMMMRLLPCIHAGLRNVHECLWLHRYWICRRRMVYIYMWHLEQFNPDGFLKCVHECRGNHGFSRAWALWQVVNIHISFIDIRHFKVKLMIVMCTKS